MRIFEIRLCEEFWGFQKEWVPPNPLTFTVRKPAFWEFWPETYMYTGRLSPMTASASCDYFLHYGDLRVVKWTLLLNLKSLLPWPLKNAFYNHYNTVPSNLEGCMEVNFLDIPSSDCSVWITLCSCQQVEQFWGFYSYLVRPGDLSGHSDIHLFKDGIKPMWEVRWNKSDLYFLGVPKR